MGITIQGEEDVEGWLKEFRKVAEQYQKEIDVVIPNRIKNKNSVVMNYAQLYKDKVGASRLKLQRLMENQ